MVGGWTDEELAALEAAWNEVADEQPAADEGFARIAESCYAFRNLANLGRCNRTRADLS